MSKTNKITIVRSEEGWRALYINNQLYDAYDGLYEENLIDALEASGLIPKLSVQIDEFNSEEDINVANTGVFPKTLPERMRR